MASIRFPKDFKKRPHGVIGATQWIYPKKGEVKVSIVGGGIGLYGDGVITFEMYDMHNEDDVHAYLTKDQINEHLKNNNY